MPPKREQQPLTIAEYVLSYENDYKESQQCLALPNITDDARLIHAAITALASAVMLCVKVQHELVLATRGNRSVGVEIIPDY